MGVCVLNQFRIPFLVVLFVVVYVYGWRKREREKAREWGEREEGRERKRE